MKAPACRRCDGTGFVLLERVADDGIGAPGRMVGEAFRCECSAGARLSSKFALAPPEGGRPQLTLMPSRKDLE